MLDELTQSASSLVRSADALTRSASHDGKQCEAAVTECQAAFCAVRMSHRALRDPTRGAAILLLDLLRPGVFQRDGAIEDELAGTGIGIEREVGEPLELIALVR